MKRLLLLWFHLPKGIFKDFSSGKGGNVVGFLMEHEKLSYPEALRYLAKNIILKFLRRRKLPRISSRRMNGKVF
jgi:DNA primase